MLDREETDPILPIREVTAFEPSVTLPLPVAMSQRRIMGKPVRSRIPTVFGTYSAIGFTTGGGLIPQE